jgi:hypothetical protein
LNPGDCGGISKSWESVAKIGLRRHALQDVRVGSAILHLADEEFVDVVRGCTLEDSIEEK